MDVQDAIDNATLRPAVPLADDAGLGLYVHWPFCRAKCPYCDFNSHVCPAVDHAGWRRALLAELDHQLDRFAPQGPLTSIFFGGGTPSLMQPETVAALIDRATGRLKCADQLEITLEANPTSVEAEKFRGFATAGVNRLSLGIQSLDDAALRFLGREHGAGEARAAIALANRRFGRTSFDLIYARHGQTAESWRDELAQALAEGTSHISLYQLTIEPGTRFHALFHAGRLPVLGDDAQAELYDVTLETLEHAGFDAYEISNFARPGQACRHNLVYWRYQDYLGIGPGAHGRITGNGRRHATSTFSNPERWLTSVAGRGHGLSVDTEVSRPDAVVEALMMGLRLAEGVDLNRLWRVGGAGWRQVLDDTRLERAKCAGLLVEDKKKLAATTDGRKLLNALLADILA